LQDAFEIFEDFVVPEAEDLVAAFLQEAGAGSVDLFIMLAAVEFDDQAYLGAEKNRRCRVRSLIGGGI
jgi:hypothetical protein